MRVRSRRLIVTCALWGGLLAALIGAGPAAAGDSDLASALRAGGFVIVIRHGATSAAQDDNNDMLHPNDVAVERQLNHEGRALAATFGNALRQLDVPVGKVYTSELNRAYETAVLAGFKDIEKTADLTEGGLDVAPSENARRAEALRFLLGTPPQPGTNTILVTHKPNIVDALGEDWSDVKEGEASIFHPENGTAKLVARVQMGEWPHLIAAK